MFEISSPVPISVAGSERVGFWDSASKVSASTSSSCVKEFDVCKQEPNSSLTKIHSCTMKKLKKSFQAENAYRGLIESCFVVHEENLSAYS
jgi:hypothetical protein